MRNLSARDARRCSLLTLFCDFKYFGWSFLYDCGLHLHVFFFFALGQTRFIGTYLIFELLAFNLVIAGHDLLSQCIDSVPCCDFHPFDLILLPAPLVLFLQSVIRHAR